MSCEANQELSIYYQNVRGLNSKLSSFYPAALSSEYQIIAITETWLSSNVNDSELFSDHYTVFRNDRDFQSVQLSKGGGVLLAFQSALNVQPIDFSQLHKIFPSINIVGCRCNINHFVFYTVLIYLPPSLTIEIFQFFFESLEQLEVLANKHLIILGDFNVRYFSDVNQQDDHKVEIVNNFLNFFSFQQFNNIENINKRLLDLIISNVPCEVTRDYVPFLQEDDHHPSLTITFKLSLSNKCKVARNRNNKSFNFKKANFPELYKAILFKDWKFLDEIVDVNEAVEQFYLGLYEIIVNHVPPRKEFKHVYPSWYTSEIINNIKTKAKYHKKFKRTSNITFQVEFKRLRKLTREQIRTAYQNFIALAQDEITQNSSRFWSFIHSKNQSSRIPSSMYFEDHVCESHQDIVNTFANSFSKIFISPCDSSQIQFSKPNTLSSNTHIFVEHICETEILQAAKRLKNKLTSGPDNIPSFLVKDCIGAFAKPLCTIFNLIMNTTVFPSQWKESKVCPIFKSGDKHNISNYRPISILSNFAKLLEIILYSKIYPTVRNTLSCNQHGFLDRRSSATNLMVLTQYISEVLDEQGQVDVVYTDFTKAFDRIDHNVLLNKLDTFGFSNRLLSFFASYLDRRIQFVAHNGFRSTNYVATSGVPQGSNLGPLLFLLFINDICKVIKSNQLLFADDLKIFASITKEDDCMLIQADLLRLEEWCIQNKLDLNPSKCSVISYTRKRTPILSHYVLNGTIIIRSIVVTDLGVIFDHTLSFVAHIKSITSQAYKMYGFILRNCKTFTNLNAIKLLFISYVRSRLEYCSVIWSPYYRCHFQSIENIQRKFLKYLSYRIEGTYPLQGIPYHTLIERHDMLSLNIRRKIATLIFLWKLMHSKIDCNDLVQQFNFYVPRLNTRVNIFFRCKTARTNLYLKSPLYSMCSLFNSICHTCDLATSTQKEIIEIAHLNLPDEVYNIQ